MSVPLETIVINGSHGEGGGALVRTAVAMSCVTQQPLQVYSVRGGLRKQGLTAEDITLIEALADSTRAEVEGAGLGATEFVFLPKTLPQPVNGMYDVSVQDKGKVPGNALVLLGSIAPVLARAGAYSEVAVRAETHNERTVCFDAFERVTVPAMRRFGLYLFPQLVDAGFGYAAKGEVVLEIEPSALKAADFSSRGDLVAAGAVVSTGDMPERVGVTAASALEEMANRHGLSLEIDVLDHSSKSKGVTVTVWAEFERGFGSGTAALSRDQIVDETANLAFLRFMEWFGTDATVDAHVADQLLLVAAQAEGRTEMTTPMLTKKARHNGLGHQAVHAHRNHRAW